MEGVDLVSLFFRGRQEQRAITSLPWVQGGPSPSGGSSLESQLALVPVFAAVRLICDSVSTLPVHAFRRTSEGRQPITTPTIIDRPGRYGTRGEWVSRGLASALMRGNAYGLKIGYDAANQTYKTIEWLDPRKVDYRRGEWIYEGRVVPESQMLHIPGLVLPSERLGVSPLAACRLAVEAGVEAQQFAATWHANRAVPSVHMKNVEQTLTSEQADTIRARAQEHIRAGQPFVTGKDWSLDFLSLSADDAGFVQSARLTASQVAAIFGVPPEMIGGDSAGSLTYSTVELNQIQFLTNTLRPWITRFEVAMSDLLPKPQYVKFNVDAMIRVDAKTRWEIHRVGREIGATNVDEIRTTEDREPLPDGQGQDYTPLAKVGAATPKEAR